MGDTACSAVTLGVLWTLDRSMVCEWSGKKRAAPCMSLHSLVCKIRGVCSCVEGFSERPNERLYLHVPVACQVLCERQPYAW